MFGKIVGKGLLKTTLFVNSKVITSQIWPSTAKISFYFLAAYRELNMSKSFYYESIRRAGGKIGQQRP